MNKKDMTESEKIQYYLDQKTLHSVTKREPVWVYLEREMLENIHKKPYNHRVGEWLKFLKELKYFFHCERIRQELCLKKSIGPAWYMQMSIAQENILKQLRSYIHKDIIEDIPRRTQRALHDLGITPPYPNKIVKEAMLESSEDPGLFFWYLFKLVFGHDAWQLKNEYNLNGVLMMSSLVFIDLEECVDELNKLTAGERPPPPPPPPKPLPPKVPRGKLGLYRQKPDLITTYKVKNHCGKPAREKPLPLDYKFKVRSDYQLELCRKDPTFLELREERNMPKSEEEMVSTYNFWQPPAGLRHTKNAAEAKMQSLFHMKPKLHVRSPYKNMEYHIVGVSYVGGKPNYIIGNAVAVDTGCVPVHEGMAMTEEGYAVRNISGFCEERTQNPECDKECDCVDLYDSVMTYLGDTKCRCGHHYDFSNEGRTKAKFFTPPTRHLPFFFDDAKIFNTNPLDDFIKEAVENALLSVTPVSLSTVEDVYATGLSCREMVKSFLADLSKTALIIPHLPLADRLPVLLEWCRRRTCGAQTEKEKQKDVLLSIRKWKQMTRVNYRARAYRIPFTEQELRTMTWAERSMIQKLFIILLDDFVYRNRVNQIQLARTMFPTLMWEKNPNRAFLECYYTYMPGRLWDTYVIEPYNSTMTTRTSKTCPLK